MFVNFDGDTVPKASENVRNSVSPLALDQDRAAAALAAALEPQAPNPGFVRSNSALTVTSAPSSTRMIRRVPRPPRMLPAPPESGISEYSSVRSG